MFMAVKAVVGVICGTVFVLDVWKRFLRPAMRQTDTTPEEREE